jgi:putative transposase
MGSRGNPYDHAKAESFMKMLKVEAVYPMASRASRASLTTFLTSSVKVIYNKRRLHSALGYLSPQ